MLRHVVEAVQSGEPDRPRMVNTLDPAPTVEELRAAVDAGDIRVAYQSKARCRSGSLAGFEALARWEHAVHGNIRPDIFLPIAESSGLIVRLTLNIASQALRWLAELPEQIEGADRYDHVLQRVQLSLNVSARTLTNRALFDELAALCRHNRIPLERVILELTETSAMEDAAVSLNTLTHLRLQGFSLSIDDFGTGYSSMVQPVRMPFSEIKVDKTQCNAQYLVDRCLHLAVTQSARLPRRVTDALHLPLYTQVVLPRAITEIGKGQKQQPIDKGPAVLAKVDDVVEGRPAGRDIRRHSGSRGLLVRQVQRRHGHAMVKTVRDLAEGSEIGINCWRNGWHRGLPEAPDCGI